VVVPQLGLTVPQCKKLIMNCYIEPWTDFFIKGGKLKNMDMRSLYRAGTLMAVSEKVSKYVTFSANTGG
jgi:hypothetical protein